jgi:type IV secretion system protein VirB10
VKLFSGKPPGAEASGTAADQADRASAAERCDAIAGDRGIPSINRARSIQSRVSSLAAITLMSVLGVGFLTWYYARAFTRPHQAQHAAELATKTRAQAEMALPALGPIRTPLVRSDPSSPTASASDPAAMEKFLGPAPALPETATGSGALPASVPPPGVPGATPLKSRGQLAFERRLAGPAFARVSKDAATPAQSAQGLQDPNLAALAGTRAAGGSEEVSRDSGRALNTLLRPTVTPAVAASVLPNRRFLLSRGAFIDCTLETAIDSTLPGMTTCVTATDTFSSDGSVVLLERGTKLVGETRGEVQQGAARLFVLWTEARTPTGVVVPLSSPGTDELGRSGLPGEVNRHFWDRFGAAILLTVLNGAVQGAVNSQNSGGSVVVSPATSTDVMTEVIRGTLNIAPTVTKAQGDRIQVFVARDVDFRPVYALRAANSRTNSEDSP